MLVSQLQSFYDEICESKNVSDDNKEKIMTYFLKIKSLYKNADAINEKKGMVDPQYLKRIDYMISNISKEKEQVLKLVEFRSKEELDAAIDDKIQVIVKNYKEALKKKEEEEAKERLRAKEALERGKENSELATMMARRNSSPKKELDFMSSSQKKRPTFASAEDTKRFEVAQRRENEERMLDLTRQMKEVAKSYTERIAEDDKILDTVTGKVEKNLGTLEKKHEKLDDILQREKRIGFFKLLFMAVIAILLFIVTAGIIFVDRTIVGARK